MGLRRLVVLALLALAGCGPVAIVAAVTDALGGSDPPDPGVPTVRFLDANDPSEDAPRQTFRTDAPFQLELSKSIGVTLLGRLVGPGAPVELNLAIGPTDPRGCPLSRVGFEVLDPRAPSAPIAIETDGMYRYVVIVTDVQGRETCRAHTWSVDTVRPTTPELLDVSSAGPSSLRLRFRGSSDEGLGVAGYRIYRQKLDTIADAGAFTGDSTRTPAPLDPKPSFFTPANESDRDFDHTITGLQPGTLYWFAISAVDGGGSESELSRTRGARTGQGPDGTFVPGVDLPVSAPAVAVRIGAVDNDVHLDIVAAVGGESPHVCVWKGRGDGTFVRQRDIPLLNGTPQNVHLLRIGGGAGLEPRIVACGRTGDGGWVDVFDRSHDGSTAEDDAIQYTFRLSYAHPYPVTSVDTNTFGDFVPDLVTASERVGDGIPLIGSIAVQPGTAGSPPTFPLPEDAPGFTFDEACVARTPAVFAGARYVTAEWLNDDAAPDLVFVDESTVRFFAGRSDCGSGPAFDFPEALAPQGRIASLFTANFDGNGFPELVTSMRQGGLVVYLNDGANFTAVRTDDVGIAFADATTLWPSYFRRDEIVLCDEGDSSVVLITVLDDGTVGEPIRSALPGPADRIATGDLNGDSQPDICVNDRSAGVVRVLWSNSGTAVPVGRFSYAGRIPTLPGMNQPSVADLNGDGAADLAAGTNGVTQDGVAIDVLTTMLGPVLDKGGALLPSVEPLITATPGVRAQATSVTDWDGDNALDIIVGGRGGYAIAFGQAPRGNPIGVFQATADLFDGFAASPIAREVRDCDGFAVADFGGAEGTIDLALLCFRSDGGSSYGWLSWLFDVDGDGTYEGSWTTAELEIAAGRTRADMIARDFDQNGEQDILIADPATRRLVIVMDDDLAHGAFAGRNARRTELDLSALPEVTPVAPFAAPDSYVNDFFFLDRDSDHLYGLVEYAYVAPPGEIVVHTKDDDLQTLSSVTLDGVAQPGPFVLGGYTRSATYHNETAPAGLINGRHLLYRAVGLSLPARGARGVVADLGDANGGKSVVVVCTDGSVVIAKVQINPTTKEPELIVGQITKIPGLRTPTGVAALDLNGDLVVDLAVTDAGDANGEGAGFHLLLGDAEVY